MAKYRCPCGAVVQTSGPIPHPDGFYVLAERQWDDRADASDFNLILESTGAHICRVCGRVWIWWDGFDREPTIYAPERTADG